MTWLEGRKRAGVLLAAYGVILAFVLLNPSAEVPSDGVGFVEGLLQDAGLSASLVQGYRVEFVLNIVALVPVSLLGSLVWPRLTWRDWTAVGFVLSLGVEALQALVIVERSATFADVVANTAGTALGAFAIGPWRRQR